MMIGKKKNNMNFKNNISTTPEQSERLLGLGVKPETADMHYTSIPTLKANTLQVSANIYLDLGSPENGETPSWSLSRLLEMMPKEIQYETHGYILMITPLWISYAYMLHGEIIDDVKYVSVKGYHLFDELLDMIEWLIKGRQFNQDYLIHSNSSKTGKEDVQ